MWIFTNKGLLSVVKDRDSDRLLVRARQKGLLQKIAPRPEEVFVDQFADYPHRVFMTRMEFIEAVYEEVHQIDYHNFKASVADPLLGDLYARVWTVMSALGMGKRYGDRLTPRRMEALPRKAWEEDGSLKSNWRDYERK